MKSDQKLMKMVYSGVLVVPEKLADYYSLIKAIKSSNRNNSPTRNVRIPASLPGVTDSFFSVSGIIFHRMSEELKPGDKIEVQGFCLSEGEKSTYLKTSCFIFRQGLNLELGLHGLILACEELNESLKKLDFKWTWAFPDMESIPKNQTGSCRCPVAFRRNGGKDFDIYNGPLHAPFNHNHLILGFRRV